MSEQEREQAEVEGQASRVRIGGRQEEAPENPQETTGEERESDNPDVEGQTTRRKF